MRILPSSRRRRCCYNNNLHLAQHRRTLQLFCLNETTEKMKIQFSCEFWVLWSLKSFFLELWCGTKWEYQHFSRILINFLKTFQIYCQIFWIFLFPIKSWKLNVHFSVLLTCEFFTFTCLYDPANQNLKITRKSSEEDFISIKSIKKFSTFLNIWDLYSESSVAWWRRKLHSIQMQKSSC